MEVTLLAVGFPIPLPLPATVKVIDRNFQRKGDVNWDGVVDDTDVRLIMIAWGSRPGDPKWNPDYDLNETGRIDVGDILRASIGSRLKYKAPIESIPATIEVAEGKCVLIGSYMEREYRVEIAKDSTVIFVFDPLGLATTAIIF